MTLGIKVAVTDSGAPMEDIVVQHAGEELRLWVYRHPRDGAYRVHVGFAAPQSFRILRAELLETPDERDERLARQARPAGTARAEDAASAAEQEEPT